MSLKPAPARPSSLLASANPRPERPRLTHTEYHRLMPAQKSDSPCLSIALTMILCRESEEHNRKPQRDSLLSKVCHLVLTAPDLQSSPSSRPSTSKSDLGLSSPLSLAPWLRLPVATLHWTAATMGPSAVRPAS